MTLRLRHLLRPSLLVILAPFLLMAPLFLRGKTMFWGTPILQFTPWWDFAWRALHGGDLPLWNPLVGMGAPLLANYQSALFYPPNWLYFILHTLGGLTWMAWAQSLLVAAHLAWASWGMLKLVRRLGWGELAASLSGLAFGASGYLVARAHFLSIIAAAAWLPWILLAAYDLVQQPRRRSAILKLVLLMALQLLAGHAQITWYTLLLAFAWLGFWAWRQNRWPALVGAWLRFGLAALFAVALAAIQLLPTFEYLLQSQRAAAVDFDFAATYSFWPWRFLTLLAPNLFGSPASGDYWGYGAYWEDAVYIGLLPFLLALAAVLRRGKTASQRALSAFLLAVIVLSFLLALGNNTPLFAWLYRNLPSFDMFQAPSRFAIWAVFALALLAGLGAESWRRPRGRALYWSRLAVAGAIAVSLGAALAWLLQAGDFVDLGAINPSFIRAIALAGLIALGVAILNLSAPDKDSREAATAWQWAAPLLLTLDLLLVGWGLNPAVDLDLYDRAPPAVQSMRTALGDHRLYLPPEEERALKFERFFSFDGFSIQEPWSNLRAVSLPNTFMLDSIASANNFDPLVSARYARWMQALAEAPLPVQDQMLARMDVSLIERQDPEAPIGVSFETLAAPGRLRWVPCAQYLHGGEAALSRILSAEVDYRRVVLLETEGREDANCEADAEASIVLVSEAPNKLSVQIDAPADGWLVLADSWYPGWAASVDAQPSEILRADYLFRAIKLPAGAHSVQFEYRPLSFYGGTAISLFNWLLFAWFALRSRSQEAADQPPLPKG